VSTPRSLLGHELDGRYRIKRRIGSGGMGSVYEAVVRSTGARVAVKVLASEYAEKPEAAARFRREARAASSISHPAVVRTLDLGATNDGIHYIVMELLEGVPLSNVLSREPVDLATFAAIVPPLLAGITAAHASYVVHRDLKPDNVFLHAPDGAAEATVKIVDFGISKVRALESVQVTGTGMILGTPYYMAPEQARGSADVDQRADVYAAGAIAYELLTGTRPYAEVSPQLVLLAMLNERPKPIATLAPNLYRGVIAWVERAMAHDPDDRFPTVSAALAALEATLRARVSEDEVAAARAALRTRIDGRREPGAERRSTPTPSAATPRGTPESRLAEPSIGTASHGSLAENAAIAAFFIGAAFSLATSWPVLRPMLARAHTGDLGNPTSHAVAAVLLALAWIAMAALSSFARARTIASSLATMGYLAAIHHAHVAARAFAPAIADTPVARAIGIGAGLLSVPFGVRVALRFAGRDHGSGRVIIRVLQAFAALAAMLVALRVNGVVIPLVVAVLSLGVVYSSVVLIRHAWSTADVERRSRALLLAAGLPSTAFVPLLDQRVVGNYFQAPTLLALLPICLLTYGAIGPDLLATGAEGIARAQGWVRRCLLGVIAVAVATTVVLGGRFLGPHVDIRLVAIPAVTALALLVFAWQALSVETITAPTLAAGALIALFGLLKLDVTLLTIVDDARTSLWISRVDHFFFVFVPVVLVHVMRAIGRWRGQRFVVWLLWGAALGVAPLALTDAYFDHMHHFWFGNLAQASWLFVLYQPVNAAAIGYGAVIVASAARTSTGARRQGLFLVLAGYVLFAILLLGGDARTVLGEEVYPYGNFGIVPGALIAYGVLRAELADLRALMRTTIAHGLASTALVALLAAAVVAITRVTEGSGALIAAVCATLVTMIVLHPMLRWAQNAIDRNLGWDQFDEAGALKAFGEATTQLSRATDVADAARRVVEQTFHPTAAAVLLPTGDGGFARGPFALDPDDPALLDLRRTLDIVRCGGPNRTPVPVGLPAWSIGTILFPLVHRGRLVAVLAIAPSSSTPLTSRRAKGFLRTLADHIAIVLENASMHGHVEAAIARKTADLGELVAKLEARLSASRGDDARAQLLQELRIRVDELERADASGTRRRDLGAALDLLQQLLAAERPLIVEPEGQRPSGVTTNPSIETLAGGVPRSIG